MTWIGLSQGKVEKGFTQRRRGEVEAQRCSTWPKAACLSLASFGGNVGMMSGFAGHVAPLRLPFFSAPLREPS